MKVQKSFNGNVLKYFTIIVFMLITTLDNSILEVPSSVYWAMIPSIDVESMYLGFVNMLVFWIVAATQIPWGFMGDRSNRKILLILGTIIWSIPLLFTPLVNDGISWLIVFVCSAFGIASISSVGLSVITDLISPKNRGAIIGFWVLMRAFGTLIGRTIGAFTVQEPSTWWKPFFLLSFMGLILAMLYSLSKNPRRGESEGVLSNNAMEYKIKLHDFKVILRKRSNIFIIACFFLAQFTWGGLIWMPFTFSLELLSKGFTESLAGITGTLIAAIFGLGGIFSIIFGHVGDKLQERNLKSRPILVAVGLSLNIPFFILMLQTFHYNVNLTIDATPDRPIEILLLLLNAVFTNKELLMMIVFALIASSLLSFSSPNAYSMMIDVNLPEHRNTVYAITNLMEWIGRGIGAFLVPMIFSSFFSGLPRATGYMNSLIFNLTFFILASASILFSMKFYKKDYLYIKEIIIARTNGSTKS
ncbi:MAG: MFS transporter [Promethearchaeota archaeon]